MNIMSIDDIVKLLREQARLRSLENDEAGILFHFAACIERDVIALSHPTPFAGLDASETF